MPDWSSHCPCNEGTSGCIIRPYLSFHILCHINDHLFGIHTKSAYFYTSWPFIIKTSNKSVICQQIACNV